MKYLTLIPDYRGSCIRDDAGNEIEIEDLKLPNDFIDEIESWCFAYREIIPLNEEQRLTVIAKIEDLDKVGLTLAETLKHLVPGGAKVKYYSEGKSRFLVS